MILSTRKDNKIHVSRADNPGFSFSYDVIVAGLGTAGAIAAITAARKGLKVLGLEKANYMGGTGTGGFIFGYCLGQAGGICEEIDRHIQKEAEKCNYTSCGKGINAELKKLYLEKEALAAGVTLSYGSTVTGVYLGGKKVVGLQWLSPCGICNAGAEVVIDCTGEAQVCFLAGCKTAKGRELDGQFQPFTNVRSVIMDDGNLSTVNFDAGYVDQTIADEFSDEIIRSSKLHLRERFDEKYKLIAISDILGAREGRRIIGEENMEFPRFMNEKTSPARIIAWSYSNHDTHSNDWAFESETAQDWGVAASLWGTALHVPVPLGAIVPKGFLGLLVAGRCIAADHDFAQSVRMKRTVQQMGEVAGIAAWLSITGNLPVMKIEYGRLSNELRQTGCLREEHSLNNGRLWLESIPLIRKGLASESPGLAIWSARRAGGKMILQLQRWLKTSRTGSNLRYHSAFALALLGKRSCLPALREMAAAKDVFLPKSSRSYNQHRGYAAIYLLGRLRDKGCINILESILMDKSMHFRFQYCSHSVMALIKIGEEHKSLRPEITSILRRFAEQPGLSLEMSLKGWLQPLVKLQMETLIRIIIANRLELWHSPNNILSFVDEKSLSIHERNILRRLLSNDTGSRKV